MKKALQEVREMNLYLPSGLIQVIFDMPTLAITFQPYR